jgi:hypothetical protein
MSTGDHQRTSRKKDRTSSTNNAGCSNAAKWPPLAGSFQYRMFGNRRSAHRRDGRCSYRAITRMSDSARYRHIQLGSTGYPNRWIRVRAVTSPLVDRSSLFMGVDAETGFTVEDFDGGWFAES